MAQELSRGAHWCRTNLKLFFWKLRVACFNVSVLFIGAIIDTTQGRPLSKFTVIFSSMTLASGRNIVADALVFFLLKWVTVRSVMFCVRCHCLLTQSQVVKNILPAPFFPVCFIFEFLLCSNDCSLRYDWFVDVLYIDAWTSHVHKQVVLFFLECSAPVPTWKQGAPVHCTSRRVLVVSEN